MRSRLKVILGALVALLAPETVYAGSKEVDLALAMPLHAAGQADWNAVSNAVGNVTYKIICPEVRDNLSFSQAGDAYGQRIVKITLEKAGLAYRDLGILSALLDSGYDQALTDCPITQETYDGPRDQRFIEAAEIYARPTSGRKLELVARADKFFPAVNYWNSVRDIYAERENARVAAEEEAARAVAAQAQTQVNAEAEAENQAQLQTQREQREAQAREFQNDFWRVVKLILFGLLLFWIISAREAIARFYYSLMPHPATSMVERALYADVAIDGKIYAQILSPVPGGKIEMEVRGKQADELTRRLRKHEAALRSTEARHVGAIKRRAEQENAFREAHLALLKAGIDHEVAAARIDELRKAMQQS